MSQNWHPANIEKEPVETREYYARNPKTHPDVLWTLSKDRFWYVRDCVAMNMGTPPACLEILSQDMDFRIRRDARKTINAQKAVEKGNVNVICLTEENDHKWGAFVIPLCAAGERVILTEEKEYPVDLFFTRIDLNGSAVFDMDKCQNRSDLLNALNWCGAAFFTVSELWDFNVDTSLNSCIHKLFDMADRERIEITAQFQDEISHETKQSIEDILSISQHLNGIERKVEKAAEREPF